jgi:hypothetical protein
MAFLTCSIARPKKSALLIFALLLGYTPQPSYFEYLLRSCNAYVNE